MYPTDSAQKRLSNVLDVIVFMQHVNVMLQLSLFVAPGGKKTNKKFTQEELISRKTHRSCNVSSSMSRGKMTLSRSMAAIASIFSSFYCLVILLNSLSLQLNNLCIQLISPPLQLRQLLGRTHFIALWHLQLAGANW